MAKTLFEQNGGTYTKQGDYCLPDIKLPDQPEYEIGVWGNRRRWYLKEHHRVRYYNMLIQCKLYPHLADIEQQAQNMFDQLVKSLIEKENITEQLKGNDMLLWVKKINNIRNRAIEIVNNEVIYV